jgi:hypothetical protein
MRIRGVSDASAAENMWTRREHTDKKQCIMRKVTLCNLHALKSKD